MPTRRQEKVARVLKETISEAISRHLSDPRIEGFVSVTEIETSPDLRSAEIYLSVFGGDQKSQNKTFEAILHARSRIQTLVAEKITGKFCPVLHFHRDRKFRKTLETMRLINQISAELEEKNKLEEEGSD